MVSFCIGIEFAIKDWFIDTQSLSQQLSSTWIVMPDVVCRVYDVHEGFLPTLLWLIKKTMLSLWEKTIQNLLLLFWYFPLKPEIHENFWSYQNALKLRLLPSAEMILSWSFQVWICWAYWRMETLRTSAPPLNLWGHRIAGFWSAKLAQSVPMPGFPIPVNGLKNMRKHIELEATPRLSHWNPHATISRLWGGFNWLWEITISHFHLHFLEASPKRDLVC